MEKRLFLALGLSVAILVVWQLIFPPRVPPKQPPAEQTQQQKETADSASDGQKPIEQVKNGSAKEAELKADNSPKPEKQDEPEQKIEEKITEISGLPLVGASFSNLTGSLKSYVLKKSKYDVTTDPKTTGKEEKIKNDLVHTAFLDKPDLLPFNVEFPIHKGFSEPAKGWTAAETDDGVSFSKETKEGVVVVKEYKFLKNYAMTFTVRIQNKTKEPVSEATSVVLASWRSPSESSGGIFSGPSTNAIMPKAYFGDTLEKTDSADELAKGWNKKGVPSFAAIDEHYFLQALLFKNKEEAMVSAKRGADGVLKVNVTLPEYKIDPGFETSHSFTVFMGPKEYNLLKETGHNLEETVDFWILGIFSRPMLWILQKSFDFLGNWGLAILVLTLVVRILMLPLTHKSQVSMARMKTLKPQMDALKEKYKEDKVEFNKQLMDLYKREKVNPLSGCLPILLQMPIYIALYRTLWGAVELYNSPFIPRWIDDLSKPEPYAIKVLPLLLGVLMFVQQKITPQAMESEQQKIMLYMMPILMTVMLYLLPSGLNLYILMSTIVGLVQQWIYNKYDIGVKQYAK